MLVFIYDQNTRGLITDGSKSGGVVQWGCRGYTGEVLRGIQGGRREGAEGCREGAGRGQGGRREGAEGCRGMKSQSISA